MPKKSRASSRSPKSKRPARSERKPAPGKRGGASPAASQDRSGAPEKRVRRGKAAPRPNFGPQRLNKVLAAAGLGSRREVEELIVQGRVEIDRDIVTDLACKVDPATVTIKVDGQKLKQFKPVYFILNKPKGVLSTNKDPSGRARVIDFVPDNERVFSVGRLDKSSEGLMLLTNDGELAQRLAHPKFRVQKTYFVVVAGQMTREELAKLKKGIYLAEGFARIDGATIRKQRKHSTELEIILSEGKNREIRRLLARAGHKVVTLRRIAIGTLRLAQLPVGAARMLSSAEVAELYELATTKKKPAKKSAKKSAKERTAGKPGSKSPKKSAPELGGTSEKPVGKPQPKTQALPFDENDDWDSDDDFGSPFVLDAEEYDDDFVGDFSGLGTQGSVIGSEEEAPSKKPRRNKKAARSKGPRDRGTPRGKVARGKASSKSSMRGTGKKSAGKKAAGKKPVGKKPVGKKFGKAKGGKPTSRGRKSSPAPKRGKKRR